MKINEVFKEYGDFQSYYLAQADEIDNAETSDIKLKKLLAKYTRKLAKVDFKYMNVGKGSMRKKSRYERKAELLAKGHIPLFKRLYKWLFKHLLRAFKALIKRFKRKPKTDKKADS